MMSKPKLLALLLLAFPIAARDYDLSTVREIEFNSAWVRYFLAKVGCPEPTNERPIVFKCDCTLPMVVRRRDFERARELAKQVFELRDK